MPSISLNIAVDGLGSPIQKRILRTGDGGGSIEIAVPASPTGTLTTRTTASSGTLTMDDAGHGISTADIIHLYWSGGKRREVLVGTVSGTSVPFSSGNGDALPVATTAIVASPTVVSNVTVDGDELQMLVAEQTYTDISETADSQAGFYDSGDNINASLILPANEARAFDLVGQIDTNRFAGNVITYVRVSNGSSTNAATFKMIWVQDSTP